MDRNIMLVERAQNGDKTAAEELCIENERLVRSIAARFTGRGTELCDLVQIAYIGLLKAVDNFDLSRGLKFSTYAVPVITGEIKRFLRDDGIIKVSRGLKERKMRAQRAEEELRRENAREPTISEVAARCGISAQELTEAYEACTLPDSFDAPCESNVDLSERLGFSEEDKIIDRITTTELLGMLTDREREIILLRYYADKTQNDVAKKIGVSQVHISRIERTAKLKLRTLIAE